MKKYNQKIKTSWYTLAHLTVFTFIVGVYLVTSILNDTQIVHTQIVEASEPIEIAKPKVVQIITDTEYKKQQEPEIFLDKLYICESRGEQYAVGDGGDSLGWYQWQYESLQDVMGQKITVEEYHRIAYNFEESRRWAKKAIFEDGQWWRWFNCTNKINNEKNN
jgi:hypothetical protein